MRTGWRGTWRRALVTGASSGLGDALARALAADGCDLVLVARNEAKLEVLATQLRSAYGVEVEVICADLTSGRELAVVERRLASAPAVDLLVNNAGVGTLGRFDQLSADGEEAQVLLNVVAPIRLTNAALPGMRARRRGTVLNIASMVALHPFPGGATYGATKTFLSSFAQALHEETRSSGVGVTVVLPGTIRTDFHRRMGHAETFSRVPAVAWLSPELVARQALDAAMRNRAVDIPAKRYRVLALLLAALPQGMRRRLAARLAARLSPVDGEP